MQISSIPPLLAAIIFSVISSIAGMALLRGGYKFYIDLLTYHRLPEDYDNLIAYNGEPEEDTVENVVESDLIRDDIGAIKRISNVPDHQIPKMLYNFEKGVKNEATEIFRSKILVLWFYSSVGNFVGVVIVAAHLAVLSSTFSFGPNMGPSLIATSFMIAGIHTAMRLAALYDFTFFNSSEDLGRDFRDKVGEIGQSFFLSLYFLWTLVVSVLFSQGQFGDAISSLPSPVWWLLIIATIILLPLITAGISEVTLRGNVDTDCISNNYDEKEIDC
jgi:hypothetical protein